MISFGVALVRAEPKLRGPIARVDIMKIYIDLQEDWEVKMGTVVIAMDCLTA